MQRLEFRKSVLCDTCSNAGQGVSLPGRSICLDCASDDDELAKEIVRLVMAAKPESVINAT